MALDRPDLAVRLRHLAAELDLVRQVWLQVDLWGEATKVGGSDEPGVGRSSRPWQEDPRLPVRGLMAIPPPEDAGVLPGPRPRCGTAGSRGLGKLRLSMGMSGDLEQAVAAGSIRCGSAPPFSGPADRYLKNPLCPGILLGLNLVRAWPCVPHRAHSRRSVRWNSGNL